MIWLNNWLVGFKQQSLTHFIWQNNNTDKDSVLSKEEIQEAVNQGNLDADVEYQSMYQYYEGPSRSWSYGSWI